MDNNGNKEKPLKYECIKCNFVSCNKKDYNRHNKTDKHIMITNDNEKPQKTPKNPLPYKCKCGKVYIYKSGLSRHKNSCNFEESSTIIKNENKHENRDENRDEMKELVFKLIHENNEIKNTLLKENQELRNQISEMIPKIGSYNNNSINNKNKFNINVFLNEKCKDALSMDEFISKIEISIKNLLTTKEKGQTQGISNIIIENMNKLSLYERPLHCTDKKRETLYIKNQEWEKDENKEFINKALKSVESKQLKNLNIWLETHPNYMNNSKQQEEFAELMSECGKSVDEGREKIIKKLCDNVYIEKIED
jgi:hypothetical protein